MYRYVIRRASGYVMLGIALASATAALCAEKTKVQGLIKGRSGATLILQTGDSPKLIVLLTDSTKVSQIKGVFKARRESMSMAALIPGLRVQVEGAYDAQQQLVASAVKFKGDDLKQARAVEAGLWETKELN